MPSPISTPLTALMDMKAAARSAIELAIDGLAQANRHAHNADLNGRAEGIAVFTGFVEFGGKDFCRLVHRGRRRDCFRPRPNRGPPPQTGPSAQGPHGW